MTPFLIGGAFPVFNTDLNFSTDQSTKFRSEDKYLFATQGGVTWQINKDFSFKGAGAYYDFYNVQGDVSSPITVAGQNFGNTDDSRPSFAQNGNTYIALRDYEGAADVPGTSQPQYFGLATPFRVVAATAQLDYSRFDPFHLSLTGEFIKNVAFDRNDIINNGPGSNPGPQNNTLNGSPGSFDGGGNGYMVHLDFGKLTLQQLWDWNVQLSYRYVETDATIDGFTDADFGGDLTGTNLKGYTVGGNLALSSRVWGGAAVDERRRRFRSDLYQRSHPIRPQRQVLRPTMNRKLLFPIVIALALILIRPALADDQQTPSTETRLRQALRDTMLQLRDAQNQGVTLQATQAQSEKDKADLQAKVDALMAQVKSVTDEAATDKAAADAAITDLKSQVTDQTGQIARLNEGLKKWKTAFDETAQIAIAKEAARAQLELQVALLQRTVDDRETKNLALFKLGNDILTRYEKFSLGDALFAKEPFIGVSRVKLETLVQDYRNKLLDQAITTGQTAPGRARCFADTEAGQNGRGIDGQVGHIDVSFTRQNRTGAASEGNWVTIWRLGLFPVNSAMGEL